MRVPFQLILLGLGIATTTFLLQSAKRAMSGKHKRSPKHGDSPSAKEPRVAQQIDPSPVSDSNPTDQEIAAAEAARARLHGDQSNAASVRSTLRCMLELPRAQTLSYVFAAQTSQGKLPDGPEPVVVDVDYVASSQLLPFESNTVSEQLQVSILSSLRSIYARWLLRASRQSPGCLQAGLQHLESKDWTEAIQGLNIVRQAAIHHKHSLEPSL